MYHPDINASGGKYEPSGEKFREVAEAYAVLSCRESRLQYNSTREKTAKTTEVMEGSKATMPSESLEYVSSYRQLAQGHGGTAETSWRCPPRILCGVPAGADGERAQKVQREPTGLLSGRL